MLDALEGFDKPLETSKPAKEEAKGNPEAAPPSAQELIWSEEFMQQASIEFERNIRMMMAEAGAEGGDPDFAENLLKVSQEAASKVFESHPEQGAAFADTLRFLAEGTESLSVPFCSTKLVTMSNLLLHFRLSLMKQLWQKCWRKWLLDQMGDSVKVLLEIWVA